jgi:hypothetical protein
MFVANLCGALGAFGCAIPLYGKASACNSMELWIIVMGVLQIIGALYSFYNFKIFLARDRVSRKTSAMHGLAFFFIFFTSNIIWFIYANFLTYSSSSDACNTAENKIYAFVRFSVYLGYLMFLIYILILLRIIISACIKSKVTSQGYTAVQNDCCLKCSMFRSLAIGVAIVAE